MVVLAVLLAYEVPHTLKQFNKSGSSAAPAAQSASPTPVATQHEEKTLPASRNGADPFVARSLPDGDPQPAAAGGPDPFTAPAPPSPPAAASPARARAA